MPSGNKPCTYFTGAHMNFSTIKTMAAAAALLAAGSSQAGLVGHQILGDFQLPAGGFTQNFFDPANGIVPAGALNSNGPLVTVSGSAREFAIDTLFNDDAADFTDNQLIISDDVTQFGAAPWIMRFTSQTDGLFKGISLVASNFDPGLTYELIGNTIVINWQGISSDQTLAFRATFDIETAAANAVPEPGSMALFGIGLAGLLARRRKPD